MPKPSSSSVYFNCLEESDPVKPAVHKDYHYGNTQALTEKKKYLDVTGLYSIKYLRASVEELDGAKSGCV